MDDIRVDERISFAWFDMETTGLVASTDIPLEVGIKLTDVNGKEIAAATWIVWEELKHWTERLHAAKKHPVVGPMHEKSGLFEAIDLARPVNYDDYDESYSREWVDDDIVTWLEDNGVRKASYPDYDGIGIAGNSVGSLDRPFALIHFPKTSAYLGHRNIDMSSFKEVCKRVNPELFAELKPIIGDKSLADHRCLGDIDACIREYRAYLDNFLFTGSEIV